MTSASPTMLVLYAAQPYFPQRMAANHLKECCKEWLQTDYAPPLYCSNAIPAIMNSIYNCFINKNQIYNYINTIPKPPLMLWTSEYVLLWNKLFKSFLISVSNTVQFAKFVLHRVCIRCSVFVRFRKWTSICYGILIPGSPVVIIDRQFVR